jgi:hypothetical protein
MRSCVFIGLLAATACHSNGRPPLPAQLNTARSTIDSIVVKRVDFEVETIVAVTCDQFDSSFGESLVDTSFVIKNPATLAEVQTLIGNLHQLQGVHVDARGQAKLYHKGRVTAVLCFDEAYMTKDGKLYALDYRLMALFGAKLQWP